MEIDYVGIVWLQRSESLAPIRTHTDSRSLLLGIDFVANSCAILLLLTILDAWIWMIITIYNEVTHFCSSYRLIKIDYWWLSIHLCAQCAHDLNYWSKWYRLLSHQPHTYSIVWYRLYGKLNLIIIQIDYDLYDLVLWPLNHEYVFLPNFQI